MQGRATVAETTGHGDAARAQAGAAEVLVVDDEPVTARGYARALSAAGYKVNVAHDGREAAAMAKAHSFDVIVSDIAMPDMDGLALLRTIRESDLDVPMIFMTGSPALESAVTAIEYGAFRYLVKPISPDAMLEAVARAVRVHNLAPRPARGHAGPRSRGQADRRPRRAGGALLVGGREAVGGRAADHLVVGTAHLRLRDAAAHRRADPAQPAGLLRRRRAAGQGRRAGAHHPAARGAPDPGDAAAGACCSSTCTPPTWRTTSCTPTTAR